MNCACSSMPGTRASCRAAHWPATASCWHCATWTASATPLKRGCMRWQRRACPIISVNSGSAAAAATCSKPWRCSQGIGSGARNAACCCRQRVRNCSTGCWPLGSGPATGIPRWMVRCGCWMAAAACSGQSRLTTCCRRGYTRSTSIPAARCGARVNCVALMLHAIASWRRWKVTPPRACAWDWNAQA